MDDADRSPQGRIKVCGVNKPCVARFEGMLKVSTATDQSRVAPMTHTAVHKSNTRVPRPSPQTARGHLLVGSPGSRGEGRQEGQKTEGGQRREEATTCRARAHHRTGPTGAAARLSGDAVVSTDRHEPSQQVTCTLSPRSPVDRTSAGRRSGGRGRPCRPASSTSAMSALRTRTPSPYGTKEVRIYRGRP